MQMGDRILCQHGDIVGVDHLRQSVVDFRVDVIRTAGKYDTAVARLI